VRGCELLCLWVHWGVIHLEAGREWRLLEEFDGRGSVLSEGGRKDDVRRDQVSLQVRDDDVSSWQKY